MKEKKAKITKFPKGFFTNIKSCKVNHSKDSKDYDKPFIWSKNVIDGKSEVKLVSNKLVK